MMILNRRYSLLAVKHKPPQGTFIYDVLMSASTESQLWYNLWRGQRTTQNNKIDKIILPINIPNTHWYVAILYLSKRGVELNIQNDIKMRDRRIEAKIMTIGKKYQQKMWIEPTEHNNMMIITPKKQTQIQTLIYKDQTRQNVTIQNLNRPRQHQNIISRCLDFNTVLPVEETEKIKEKDEEICTQLRMSSQQEVEEVIYSEGEYYEEIYPDNTWDSDDDVSLT